ENKQEIIERTLSKEGIATDIVEKFNPEIGFGERKFASMLFYLGYLTIGGEEFGMPILQIPNKIMQDIYSNYFIDLVSIETDLRIDPSEYNQITKEIALEGKINKITEKLHLYLNNLSNRDFQRFDEKYVKLLFYSIAMNLKIFSVKSEMEVNRKYPDLLIVPKDYSKNYKGVMIEFKYLKKDESNKLQEKQEEARKQILEYSEFEDIKAIPNLSKYTVIAVNDEIYVEKI
ncbi:MAG: PD-(D/E)XK nuclease domain-containing protein, partial [Clostridia bacterium]|nr:PD-(D/E)XK nuclease domain-containing protein [Clostridia bacterium]